MSEPDEEPIDPHVDANGVPWCREDCRQHDGKRCRMMGFKPDRICEPAVIRLNERLARSRQCIRDREREALDAMAEADELRASLEAERNRYVGQKPG